MFRTFQMFCRVMDQCTEDYHCLVIHNNAKSSASRTEVFWYKASPHEDFRIGHPSFWKYDAERDPETDDDDDFSAGEGELRVVKADYFGRRPHRR